VEAIDAARRLLALRSIEDNKAIKAQLKTEEQLKDLAVRLNEADKRMPVALQAVYRHILVPAEKKTIRSIPLDMSVSKATLSQRVLDKLKDEQQILEKLDPAILIGDRFGLWPADKEIVSVKALTEYFTQLTHLPRLLNNSVVPECIAKGVQRGLFAYALGDADSKQFDTILIDDASVTSERCEVTDSAWLLRPALAKSLMPEPEPARPADTTGGGDSSETTGTGGGTSTGGDGEWTGGGGVKIVGGERRLNRVRIAMRLPWDNWNDIYNEVIDPLAKEGADVVCEVTIVAKGEAAIRENTVELGIRESLSQRGIDADIQTG
jgi:hypothetical protein